MFRKILLVIAIVLVLGMSVCANTYEIPLNLFDRILLLNVLPEKGNMVTLKAVMSIKENVGLTDEEIETYMEDPSEGLTVKDSKYWTEIVKEIRFSKVGVEIVSKALEDLNEKESLTTAYIRIYEIFVDPGTYQKFFVEVENEQELPKK